MNYVTCLPLGRHDVLEIEVVLDWSYEFVLSIDKRLKT